MFIEVSTSGLDAIKNLQVQIQSQITVHYEHAHDHDLCRIRQHSTKLCGHHTLLITKIDNRQCITVYRLKKNKKKN